MQQIQPKSQHEPIENKIPSGTALTALAASSLQVCQNLIGLRTGPSGQACLICTAESNPPMVQIGLSQDSMNAHPDGQVVRFSTCVKIYEALFRDDPAPMGKAIMVAKIRTKFIITNTDCNLPITLAMVDAITP
jgi:hypothetical protein